jgi:hypothetical protein
MDEDECLMGLVHAAVQGWVRATRFGTIRLLVAGVAAAAKPLN